MQNEKRFFNMKDNFTGQLEEAILVYDKERVKSLTEQAVGQGVDPLDCAAALTAGIREVGKGYESGELFLPDLIGAANAMQAAMPIINRELKKQKKQIESLGKVVIGTVFGDVHNIGKTMVATLLTAEGFEVIDLGVNIRAEEFVKAIKSNDANILAMSALLTTTMIEQKHVIKLLEQEGIRSKVKIMVGGAPVTQAYAEEMGADGTAATAVGAVQLAKRFISNE
jgi:corrinoid protein of di/trimethylamine methyltransferase